jgi:hypothetical protein
MKSRNETRAAFIETTRAMRTITTAELRADLTNQLRQAASALKRNDLRTVTAYMQGLVTTVLILRRALSARTASGILAGIEMDCQKLGVALPLVNYKDKSRCVFNTGNCTQARNSKCVTIDTAWGCGTVPRLRVIA